MDKLLAGIDLAQPGLEIGALCRPIVPPHLGNIRYVDHLDTPGLRAKFAGDASVDVDKLVHVDFVWGEQTLPQAVGGERFDYVIASHVIEHVPDTIGWLREIAAVLNPGGRLALAIPDKRFTFDIRRELSALPALLEAFLHGRRRPAVREILDFACNVVSLDDPAAVEAVWRGDKTAQDFPLLHPGLLTSLGEAGLRQYFDRLMAGEYLDVHVHVYTPDSFMALLSQLAQIKLLPFSVLSFVPTAFGENEFFVSLQRLADELPPGQARNLAVSSQAGPIHG
ncbi:class I SAM-dependent methyltransferase [Chitinimonas sp.]|uniref:class I SAM-dependent methyltransferase n=1 Tax=Chitinimonas sp. TaxID=1934313 RepID=UPI0035AE10DA